MRAQLAMAPHHFLFEQDLPALKAVLQPRPFLGHFGFQLDFERVKFRGDLLYRVCHAHFVALIPRY